MDFKTRYSDFWLGGFGKNTKQVTTTESSMDLAMKLDSHKRAIANFVRILTGQNIPVIYKGQESFTDGRSVVIGSDLINVNHDETVGLALHEGSHILKTDFDTFKSLMNDVRKFIGNNLHLKSKNKGMSDKQMANLIKALINIIEDRRIDNFVYSTSPGYRGYYKSLYDKYFRADVIDKGLQSDEYRAENLESYMFRIINLVNFNTDITALKGLPAIWKTIDLKNISRLKSTKETVDVSKKVYEIIIDNITDANSQKDENGNGEGEGNEGEGQESGEGAGNLSDEEKKQLAEELKKELLAGNLPSGGNSSGSGSGIKVDIDVDLPGSPSQSGSSDDSSDSIKIELTPEEKSQLEELIKKQEQFVDGNTLSDKKDLEDTSNESNVDASEVSKNLNKIKDGKVSVKPVGTSEDTVSKSSYDPYNSKLEKNYKGFNCIVYNDMTRELINSKELSILSTKKEYDEAVREGLRKGKMLGKKIKIRDEERTTVFNRKRQGRIDKRMIAYAGAGYDSIFYESNTELYKKANIHISIDASGSMAGDKFYQSMVNVSATAMAASMISNVHITISFRSTMNHKNPVILIAYDSRKDNISKVRDLFGHIRPNNLTPEGLCFEAIMNTFVRANNDNDSYFINISDGEPYFSAKGWEYTGMKAAKHTRNQVIEMEKMGIKILSYYVGSSSRRSDVFEASYGSKNTAYIDVTNINEISREMNRLMLRK